MDTSNNTPGSSLHKTDQPPSNQVNAAVSSSINLSAEERLIKEWRTMTNGIVGCLKMAEKAATETTRENCMELDKLVVNFLKTRMMWHRLMSHVQAKVQGTEEEMEALENYVRTQPRLGKRKRDDESPIDASAELPLTISAPPTADELPETAN